MSIKPSNFGIILQIMNNSANSTDRGSKRKASEHFTTHEIIAGSVILVILILSAIIGNVLTCLVVYKKPSFRTGTNISILFLAVSDILMATLAMPFSFSSLVNGNWLFSSEACTFNTTIIGFSVGVSMTTMTCTAVIRYLSVVKPASHQQYVKPKAVAIGIFTLWLLNAIGQAVLYFVTSGYGVYIETRLYCKPGFQVKVVSKAINVLYLAGIYISSLTIFLAYFKVFRFVSHHNHTVASNLQQANPSHIEEAKITKTLVIVVLGFMFCWVPVTIIEFAESFVYSQYDQLRMPHFVFLFQTMLMFTSSAINPFIYGFTNKRFRKQYFELLAVLRPSSPQVAPVVIGSS